MVALTGGLNGSAVLSLFLSSRLLLCHRLLLSAAVALRTFPRSSATGVVEECVVRLAQYILLTVLHARVLFGADSATGSLQGKDGQNGEQCTAQSRTPLPATRDGHCGSGRCVSPHC